MDAAPLPPADLRGRTVLVTGANAGIGYWCAEQLAARGARVLLGCRSRTCADRGRRDPKPGSGCRPARAGARPRLLDSIALAATGVGERLDAVICNAG